MYVNIVTIDVVNEILLLERRQFSAGLATSAELEAFEFKTF